MASPTYIQGNSPAQEPTGFSLSKATPPEKDIQFPITPPATGDRRLRTSDRFAVNAVLRIFRQHQDHSLSGHRVSRSLEPEQYELLLKTLEQSPELDDYVRDKVRYDYDPRYKLLSIRMPTPVHDFFAASVADEIKRQLRIISDGSGSSSEFAAQICNGGSARLYLLEADADEHDRYTKPPHRREPDAQFQHRDAKYPGVVLEVSYSQDGKDLRKLARDYIQYSNGDIKVVIGINLEYRSSKEATLSVWHPRYIHEDGEEWDILDVEETITSQPFRGVDGSVVCPEEALNLSLNDFATDEISAGFDVENAVVISYRDLAQFLQMAEEMHLSREPAQGSGGQKSKRRTRKRARSSSPVDQLGSGDEARLRDQESKAEARVIAADGDFEYGPLDETHDLQLPRNTRQRLK